MSHHYSTPLLSVLIIHTLPCVLPYLLSFSPQPHLSGIPRSGIPHSGMPCHIPVGLLRPWVEGDKDLFPSAGGTPLTLDAPFPFMMASLVFYASVALARPWCRFLCVRLPKMVFHTCLGSWGRWRYGRQGVLLAWAKRLL